MDDNDACDNARTFLLPACAARLHKNVAEMAAEPITVYHSALKSIISTI